MHIVFDEAYDDFFLKISTGSIPLCIAPNTTNGLFFKNIQIIHPLYLLYYANLCHVIC